MTSPNPALPEAQQYWAMGTFGNKLENRRFQIGTTEVPLTTSGTLDRGILIVQNSGAITAGQSPFLFVGSGGSVLTHGTIVYPSGEAWFPLRSGLTLYGASQAAAGVIVNVIELK